MRFGWLAMGAVCAVFAGLITVGVMAWVEEYSCTSDDPRECVANCDVKLRKYLVSRGKSADVAGMNALVEKVHDWRRYCADDLWGPEVVQYVGATCSKDGKIGEVVVPVGLQRGSDLDPGEAVGETGWDDEGNLLVYFWRNSRPSDDAICWTYSADLKEWGESDGPPYLYEGTAFVSGPWLACDRVLKDRLMRTVGRHDVVGMNEIVRQIQEDRLECASDLWGAEIISGVDGTCSVSGKVGDSYVPLGLQRGGKVDPWEVVGETGWDAENNLIVYFR